jgi:D-aminopeptidase
MLRCISVLILLLPSLAAQSNSRGRAREFGIAPGSYLTGPHNAITDVAGVRVGHVTLREGDNIRTGITAILPHGRNLFREKVAGAVWVFNAFGKLMGSTQVEELGEIETPILLTSTLNVPRVADGLISYMLNLPGNEDVRSINPLVGETNDGQLNDSRRRVLGEAHVRQAILNASEGKVAEGAVGAGTGTVCFGYKGGIGTSSRIVGRHTVGVLVQSNFGGSLRVLGQPVNVGRTDEGKGSIMMVVATDAPLDARQLKRLAARTALALGRVGSNGSHGSGDYAIAFSTTARQPGSPAASEAELASLFPALIDATEEAIYNSLFLAETTSGNGRTVEALPLTQWKRINSPR